MDALVFSLRGSDSCGIDCLHLWVLAVRDSVLGGWHPGTGSRCGGGLKMKQIRFVLGAAIAGALPFWSMGVPVMMLTGGAAYCAAWTFLHVLSTFWRI